MPSSVGAVSASPKIAHAIRAADGGAFGMAKPAAMNPVLQIRTNTTGIARKAAWLRESAEALTPPLTRLGANFR